MNPYSVDLRARVVAAVQAGTPRAEVQRLFQISAATLKRYVKQQRDTNDLTPRPHTGGRQPALPSDQHATLQQVIGADPAATLQETCTQWATVTGVQVRVATMCRARAQIGWTRKKRR